MWESVCFSVGSEGNAKVAQGKKIPPVTFGGPHRVECSMRVATISVGIHMVHYILFTASGFFSKFK